MFSGTTLILKIQIIKHQFLNLFFSYLSSVVLSNKESYGGEALLGPDVDYLGDRYRTRSNVPLVFRLIHC